MRKSIVLKPSPWKWLGMLVLFVTFTVMSGILANEGNPVGTWGVLGFGVGVLISVMHFVPGSNYLELDEKGFIVCSLYRTYRIEWHEVELFGVSYTGNGSFVAYKLVPESDKFKINRHISKALMGWHAILPDTYRLTPHELANTMNEWRRACAIDMPQR